MPIAEFVNAKQIQEMFVNDGASISYQKACEIKNDLKKAHKKAKLPSKYVIPKAWVLEVYGDQAY